MSSGLILYHCGFELKPCFMKTTFLDFEQPIAELETKIDELRFAQEDSAVDISAEIARLQKKSQSLTHGIYAKLTPWQISQVARHPQRPYTLDYIQTSSPISKSFTEIAALPTITPIVGGLARFDGQAVMVIGHQKGRDTKEKIHRNFGMPKPEGYRKALRLMRLAEKFSIPLLTFIDTPGAYPGIGAEERGQSEAIGHNLYVISELKVPVICTVIGEGGSGGALAVAVGDVVQMLQYATYSVISPEGCASIFGKALTRRPKQPRSWGSPRIGSTALGPDRQIISEPAGGAHRDYTVIMQSVSSAVQDSLGQLQDYSIGELLERRFERLMGMASSRKPKSNNIVQQRRKCVATQVPGGRSSVLALSGGVDSACY